MSNFELGPNEESTRQIEGQSVVLQDTIYSKMLGDTADFDEGVVAILGTETVLGKEVHEGQAK